MTTTGGTYVTQNLSNVVNVDVHSFYKENNSAAKFC